MDCTSLTESVPAERSKVVLLVGEDQTEIVVNLCRYIELRCVAVCVLPVAVIRRSTIVVSGCFAAQNEPSADSKVRRVGAIKAVDPYSRSAPLHLLSQ